MVSKEEIDELDCFIARECPPEKKKGIFGVVKEVFAEILSSCRTPESLDEINDEDIDELNEYIVRNQGLAAFNEKLRHYMSEKNLDRTEVCERAKIDRRFIAKILDNEGYIPRKHTVMALALALHLNLREYDEFMALAGYSADSNLLVHLIVRFCIIKGCQNEIYYDIDQKVNGFLKAKKQKEFAYNTRKVPDIDLKKCTGCGQCAKAYPGIYEIKAGKAYIKVDFSANIEEMQKSSKECPENAIRII